MAWNSVSFSFHAIDVNRVIPALTLYHSSSGVWKVEMQEPVFYFDPFIIVSAPTKVINGKVLCAGITQSKLWTVCVHLLPLNYGFFARQM